MENIILQKVAELARNIVKNQWKEKSLILTSSQAISR